MFLNSFASKLIVLNILFVAFHVHGGLEGDPCIRKYDNSPGICENLRSCPKVREEYDQGIPLTICAYLSGQKVVCCPETIVTQPTLNVGSKKRISERKCDEYAELTKENVFVTPLAMESSEQQTLSYSKCDSTTTLIVGGEKTKNGEYPHMAAIGWRSIDLILSFKCGGSLISELFVLTAAHCGLANGESPSIVRLGDQNIASRKDGLIEVDVPIAEFITHGNYNQTSFYDDIALIKMSRAVNFSKFIRPACLWQSSEIASPKTVATGWGYTESIGGQVSDELMKVELDIINNHQCDFYFNDPKLDRGIISSQVCAGVLKGLKSTCSGDSGGPIQIVTDNNTCLYYVIGVTSVGNPFCALKNSPGVFTRVSSYIDWIEENVWR